MPDTNMIVKVTLASVVIVTNWVSIGSFTDKAGRQYDVLQGSIQTNWVGKMQAEGQTFEHVFKSTLGPTNDHVQLVPIATQTLAPTIPPPLPVNMKFVYTTQTNYAPYTNR